MSQQDELNWSTDLRRISWWLQTGKLKLAQQFIQRGQKLYPEGKIISNKNWSWWFTEINNPNSVHAAERALTWSLLLR